jgi:hypothetical protein
VLRFVDQPAERRVDILARQPFQMKRVAAGNHLRQHGAHSDACGAAASLESRLGDAAARPRRRQSKYVATHRIRHLDSHGRRGQFSSVARILEMIQKNGRVQGHLLF